MKEKIRDIVDAAELLLEVKFIDFKMKLFEMEIKQISSNPFLTFCERQKEMEITYNKYKSL